MARRACRAETIEGNGALTTSKANEPGRRLALAPVAALLAALTLPLAGCVDTAGQARIDPPSAPNTIARRPGVSPQAATVALASLDGAPASVLDSFRSAFGAAAGAQDLTTVDPAKAEYLVRGYLNAGPGAAGATRLAFVFDLFDRSKRRIARLEDFVAVPGASADPWTLANDSNVQALAVRSARDLADALTNTPEAVAAVAISAAPEAAPRRAAAATSMATGASVAARAEPTGARLGFAAAR